MLFIILCREKSRRDICFFYVIYFYVHFRPGWRERVPDHPVRQQPLLQPTHELQVRAQLGGDRSQGEKDNSRQLLGTNSPTSPFTILEL